MADDKIHSKPLTLYVESINGAPDLVLADRVSHIDIELDQQQLHILLKMINGFYSQTMHGSVRIRFTGRIQN